MSKDNRPRSWKEMRAHRATQKSFIGREAQIKLFRAILSTPYDQRNQVIFNISGQGGIGKTTLLKQFCRIAEDLKQLIAYVDEGAQSNRVDDLPEALYRLAMDFEKQGHKFDKFQERYKTYRQKRQELEADPDAPQGFAAGLGRMLTKASLGAAKSIPGSRAVLDLVETDAVANKAGEYLAFIARKLTNKDEVLLLREPLEVLTPLFLEDLNQIAEKQTVVLLLDTYEQTGAFLDDWLRSLLDDRYGYLTPNFLLVIAGRDPLSRNIWADMESCIARSELEPFTQDETRQYLTNRGITNEAVIQEIWRLSSGGLPLLIGMMAQATPNSINVVVDPCEEAVERFLKWESDGTKRQLALDAALPRMLNRDILALLVDESAVNDLFEWLKERSFVVEHPEGWQYHNIVREQMLRYQRRISPQAWTKQHKQLAEYYDELRKSLGLTDTQQLKNETWQKYTLEWLYHSLCANPLQQMRMALNGWLMALDTSQKFAQEWAEAMNMAGIATSSEDIKRWSQQFLNGLKSLAQNHSGEIVEVLSALLQVTLLEDKCRAIALVYQGMFPLLCFISKNNIFEVRWKTEEIPNLNHIKESLTQAISLAPDKEECFIFRGMVNIFKGNIDEAKSDLNRVLQQYEIDRLLKQKIELVISEDYQSIEYVKGLFKEEEFNNFNLFQINEITEKINQDKNKEIQILNEEKQRLEKKIEILQGKAAKRSELNRIIWKLIEESSETAENSQKLTEETSITEAFKQLGEILHKRTEEVKKLKEEIQMQKEGDHVEKEEIKKLEKEFQTKSIYLQKLIGEATRLVEELKKIEAITVA
ncbi:MAG: hypothetical protein RMX68_019480 [Aulosira sp. ZfuVER01]|nr:hypothetical protein [Aulosira sp. ZfuVER01]MDZ8002433.1 hypothetical protein [Aulosira sp. DedVER01a]MDZ8054124.1 hypothetical protein [Aulosira sp. ZfuCHP01]